MAPEREEAGKPALTVAGLTDPGLVRTNNEDYFGYYIPEDPRVLDQAGSLFAVSDGMGGASAGEVASAEAVNVLLQEYYFSPRNLKAATRLKAAFDRTNAHIYRLANYHSSFNRMQCTLTVLLLRGKDYHIAHVGDSRAYLLRGGQLTALTKDHSLVGRMERLGVLSSEEARQHPNRHVLTRSVGEAPIPRVDVISGRRLPASLFFLATDGVTGVLSDEELREFLLAPGALADRLAAIIMEVNRRGGNDNATVLAVEDDGEVHGYPGAR